MFVKDRDRHQGDENWIPALFAFFWIVLGGFAGAYLYDILSSEELLEKEVALAASGEAAATQALSAADKKAIRELTATVEDLKRQLAELSEKVESAQEPAPSAEARSEPEPAPEPEPPAESKPVPTVTAGPLPDTTPEAPAQSDAVSAAVPSEPEPESRGGGAVRTSPPGGTLQDPGTTGTASPATPQTDQPDEEDEDKERRPSPQNQAATENAPADEKKTEQTAGAEETPSQTVTYGANGTTEETPKEDPAKALELAAISDPSMKFGIEIGSVETQQGLRPMWRKLLTNHAALVAGLEARRVLAPDKTWRLIAGPFDNPTEATQACALFRKAELPCEATVFAGDSL